MGGQSSNPMYAQHVMMGMGGRSGTGHGDGRDRRRERERHRDDDRDDGEGRDDEVITTIFVVGFPDDLGVSLSDLGRWLAWR